MQIEVNHIEGKAVVTIRGDLDALTTPEATQYLESLVEAGNVNLIVDLGQVNYMSSAGLRMILVTLKKSREKGGDLRLAAPNPGVEKILEITGFDNIIRYFPDVQSAIGSA